MVKAMTLISCSFALVQSQFPMHIPAGVVFAQHMKELIPKIFVVEDIQLATN
jgi:hypothetical protein